LTRARLFLALLIAMHLWVDADHPFASNSTTRANNTAEAPWANPLRGTHGNMNRASAPTTGEALQPGDTLHVKPKASGEPYTFTWAHSDESEGPVFAPANSGTSSEPIVITGDGAGFTLGVDFVKLGAEGDGNANVIGGIGNGNTPATLNKGWYIWRGFRINENEQLGSESWPCYFVGCHDSTVEYCDFIGETPEFNATLGRLISPTRGDNHNASRCVYCLRITIQNNRMRSFYPGYVNPAIPTAGNQLNGNACEVYTSAQIIFRNNDVGDCATGVYYKAPNHVQDASTTAWGTTGGHHAVFKNRFNDCDQGIAVHRLANADEANGFRGYRNLLTAIRGTPFRFHRWDVSGDQAPCHVKLISNTVVCRGQTVPAFELYAVTLPLFAGMGAVSQNNLFLIEKAGVEGVNTAETSNNNFDGSGRWQTDRNCYAMPSARSGNAFLVSNGGNLSLANWRALPSGTNQLDQNFLTDDPLFVNEAGGDYHLSSGQAHETFGRAIYGVGGADGTVIPLGAFIDDDIIGIIPFAAEGETVVVPIIAPPTGRPTRYGRMSLS
jgi:hypothetical protein